jgi:hypothetical protein
MTLPSHVGNGAAEVTWPRRDVDVESYWRWRYRVMLAMTLPRRLGHSALLMPSHDGDGVTEVTWAWRDAESCW